MFPILCPLLPATVEISKMAEVQQDSDQHITVTFNDDSPPFVFETNTKETTKVLVQGIQTLMRNKGMMGYYCAIGMLLVDWGIPTQ